MVKVSVSSMFLWDCTPEEMLFILDESGLDGLELWAETPWYWERRCRPRFLDMAAVLGGRVRTVHAPVMDMNPSSYSDLVHQATIVETLRAVDMAHDLGVEVLTIHPGHRTARRAFRPADWKKFYRYLDACLIRSRRLGVILSLENLQEEIWNICYQPEEMAAVLEKYPLAMTLDISHATPPISRALSFVDRLFERIVNVHVSATVEGNKHMPPSDGSMDSVLMALRDAGYQGFLTLELDDKKYPNKMGKMEKASALRTESRHLLDIFG
ncbi:MAG: sugar phosphate isomerase/epimerase [Methanosarcinales archaeon]|nr:sugar phosphate isomerase/epimerase [Methanosarcinales archaeon]